MELAANLLYFSIVICILALFCVWYIFIVLVASAQEIVLKTHKLFVKAFKLLKHTIFRTH